MQLKNFSFNQLLNTVIILEQEINFKTKVAPKHFVPLSIFIIGGFILPNNSTSLKQEKT